MESPPPSKRQRSRAGRRPDASGEAGPSGKVKVFNDAVLGHVEIHPVCVRVMDTVEFQRLRRLKQLGPTEWVFPGATHQRFAHSIGVSFLGGQLVERLARNQPELRVDARDVLCVKLAGLCHDLGHGPLSHTYDGAFVRRARPGLDWCHEHTSAAMFARIVEKYDLLDTVFADYGLDASDVHFVQELIFGDVEEAPKGWTWVGRGADKAFLYEIVSNHRNGIDVDKRDSGAAKQG